MVWCAAVMLVYNFSTPTWPSLDATPWGLWDIYVESEKTSSFLLTCSVYETPPPPPQKKKKKTHPHTLTAYTYSICSCPVLGGILLSATHLCLAKVHSPLQRPFGLIHLSATKPVWPRASGFAKNLGLGNAVTWPKLMQIYEGEGDEHWHILVKYCQTNEAFIKIEFAL